MKNFIITVDTEGDNLWHYEQGKEVTTRNASYIPRFQYLCEKYGYKPVYLTNFEMANSTEYCDFAKTVLLNGNAEIGIHVHAWNNPPLHKMKGKDHGGNSYLIEYPDNIMYAKFKTTYDLIKNRFGITPKSHRSGRWAMDERYFRLLEQFGIIADCSYTPGISWTTATGQTVGHGSDYSKSPQTAHIVGKVLEVPMTIRHFNHYFGSGSLKHRLKTLLVGGHIWLRPALCSFSEMKHLVSVVHKEEDNDYLEFMIHSSELMPGGSPYFTTAKQIDVLFVKMESLFDYVANLGYQGVTLADYALQHSDLKE